MPYTLTFPLHPEEAAALPLYPGRALHALFYPWLALGDYALSTQVHDSNGPLSLHRLPPIPPSAAPATRPPLI